MIPFGSGAEPVEDLLGNRLDGKADGHGVLRHRTVL
jgi:hypothetical protein